jgi:hypothetical protein
VGRILRGAQEMSGSLMGSGGVEFENPEGSTAGEGGEPLTTRVRMDARDRPASSQVLYQEFLRMVIQ